jgi:hypothetical protein
MLNYTNNIDLKNRILTEGFWITYLEHLGCLDMTLIECLPEFMVISPGKTGTTWLSKNLSCHPEIFIPEVKEVRYFCTQWRMYDINWYLKHFQEGIGLTKGEVSPTYAILPSLAIKLLRLLVPNLKLILLMRDPIDRAWSHTKHNYKYREANFHSYGGDFQSIPDRKLMENFMHEWPFSFGDYLGSLKRWLSFFPKKQLFIGFYENIKRDPQRLLSKIFTHLDVESEVDWSKFPISEAFLKGIGNVIPERLKKYLRAIYRRRTEELIMFLKEQFGIVEIPSEWENTLVGDGIPNPFIVEEDYKGYNILVHEDRFYALPEDTQNIDIVPAIMKEYQGFGRCLVGESLFEARYLVDQLHYHGSLKVEESNRLSGQSCRSDFDDYYLINVLDEILENISGV